MTGRESQASLFVGRSPCGHRPWLETTKTRRCRWSRQSCLQVEGVTQRPDFQGPRCDRWVSTRRPRPRCPDPLQYVPRISLRRSAWDGVGRLRRRWSAIWSRIWSRATH